MADLRSAARRHSSLNFFWAVAVQIVYKLESGALDLDTGAVGGGGAGGLHFNIKAIRY